MAELLVVLFVVALLLTLLWFLIRIIVWMVRKANKLSGG